VNSIILNDKPIQSSATTVDELIEEQKINRMFLAIMVNNEIIAKSEWDKIALQDNDKVDIYSPVGGG
jgi:thiamine biosynthesis protein ThiS